MDAEVTCEGIRSAARSDIAKSQAEAKSETGKLKAELLVVQTAAHEEADVAQRLSARVRASAVQIEQEESIAQRLKTIADNVAAERNRVEEQIAEAHTKTYEWHQSAWD